MGWLYLTRLWAERSNHPSTSHAQITMTSQRRIPPPLEPYIAGYTKDSLLLLTDTVGTSASWLALQFLAAALSRDNTAVVVASWMRPIDFWKQELARACVGPWVRPRGSNRLTTAGDRPG
jgi:hypothetical protein